MSIKRINIARDFSRHPAGRYLGDGDYSAQAFREKLLHPALQDDGTEKLIIELDGGAGYSSSFLEEAFGGLVRVHKYKKEYLNEKLEFSAADANLIEEILQYINEA